MAPVVAVAARAIIRSSSTSKYSCSTYYFEVHMYPVVQFTQRVERTTRTTSTTNYHSARNLPAVFF